MIFIKSFFLFAHVLDPVPDLGDHHHDRVRHRSARQDDHFKSIVKRRRVARVRFYNRQYLLHILTESFGNKLHLPGAHPVDIATKRIDLSVMGDHTIRMRQRPSRKCVGAITRVYQGNGGNHVGIVEIGIKSAQLPGHQLPFINEGLARKAAKVIIVPLPQSRFLDGIVEPLANHIKLPLKGRLRCMNTALDKDLLERRHDRTGHAPDLCFIARHIPPTKKFLTFFVDNMLEPLLNGIAVFGIDRQENNPRRVITERRQLDVDLGALFTQEDIRHLYQNTRAVSRQRITPASPTMRQVLEDI